MTIEMVLEENELFHAQFEVNKLKNQKAIKLFESWVIVSHHYKQFLHSFKNLIPMKDNDLVYTDLEANITQEVREGKSNHIF